MTRVLALPLAGMAAPDHERAGPGELGPGPGERADQRGHALEAEEPADEEQHGRVVVHAEQPVEVGVRVRAAFPAGPVSVQPCGSSTR